MCDTLVELQRLVGAYHETHALWLATVRPGGDLDADCDEYETLMAIAQSFLRTPCASVAAAHYKVAAVLAIEGLYTMVKEDEDGEDEMLRTFLASLFPVVTRRQEA